ncbi:uncharacterized protein LOC108808418 [Raphanus sativus]|uniref:Uncharacterized protein LOC108808418 n=1 Tax=Raphanus sativus TaxID=3726 RepID=A0A9W3D5C7_RAPSA|nr:uncharacterized protein LOC108808418 [Raphanus sativus]XP_056859130.1 uncharacterized protein LOC108808418 [Raphanus sativus]
MFSKAVEFDYKEPGRSSSTVEVRLLRFWEASNVRRGGELMGIDMLLLDSQSTMMPATVNVNHLATHQTNLEAGFSDSSTSFKKVTEPAVQIPLQSFRFRNHREMLGLANSNNQLPDLIGEITAVKSTVTDLPHDKNRVMATIKMENGTYVIMSLFDDHAVKIHDRLEKMRSDPKVVVATSVNPKMVGGRLFLNATSGTHIYFDKETNAGESLFLRLVTRDTGLAPVAPLLKSYAKVEKMSVSELNDFVVTAPSQYIELSVSEK